MVELKFETWGFLIIFHLLLSVGASIQPKVNTEKDDETSLISTTFTTRVMDVLKLEIQKDSIILMHTLQ